MGVTLHRGFESRPLRCRRATLLSRLVRGAEHVVPERGADAVAALVVLEMVAHVELAKSLAERRLRPVMVHVVVQHVVEQVAAEEAGVKGQEARAPEDRGEAPYE